MKCGDMEYFSGFRKITLNIAQPEKIKHPTDKELSVEGKNTFHLKQKSKRRESVGEKLRPLKYITCHRREAMLLAMMAMTALA
jgi:hypothetical protein